MNVTPGNPDPLNNGRSLSRRNVLMAALATPALASWLVACGDGTKATEPTTDSTLPPTTVAPTTPPAPQIEHPTGPDDVVMRVGYVGGYVPVGYAFTSIPTMLVSGDGRLIEPGATIEIFPGPLLPALSERTISEAGIQNLLTLADGAGLLAPPPDYSGEILVADAPDTQVILAANGETFIHQAPALGFEEPNVTEARKTLAKFVEDVGDIETAAGAENLGPAAPLVATSYRIQARVVTTDELAGYDPEPTVVPWPAEMGVALADADTCAVVSADKAGPVLESANQLTFFSESTTSGEAIYQVAAVAVLPGDVC